jgi:hypothetical protein
MCGVCMCVCACVRVCACACACACAWRGDTNVSSEVRNIITPGAGQIGSSPNTYEGLTLCKYTTLLLYPPFVAQDVALDF